MYKLSCLYDYLYRQAGRWSHVYAERAWDTSYETGSRRETRHANPQPSRLTAVSGDEPTPCVTTLRFERKIEPHRSTRANSHRNVKYFTVSWPSCLLCRTFVQDQETELT